MHGSGKNDLAASVEAAVAALSNFDFGVDPDDFVFYELIRLIEEERASLDDAGFRRLIDEGLRAHVEENLQIRARIAGVLRRASASMKDQERLVVMRVVRGVEDINSDLANVAVLARVFTVYLLERLEVREEDATADARARSLIESWQGGETLLQTLNAELSRLGRAAVPALADLLFESVADRSACAAAIGMLGKIDSPVSGRVLAHAVSEPLFDEDLEAAAFAAVKALWPLPRAYMIYDLRGHTHEDIPRRWFELFAQTDDLLTVDLALEEVRVHGDSPNFQEDLAAMLDALNLCRDPEIQNKLLGALNAEDFPAASRPMLEEFLRQYRAPPRPEPDPWAAAAAAAELNRKYAAAARHLDQGDHNKAGTLLDEILHADSQYPFALMLKEFLKS
jgi:hypothetical protein